MQLSFKKYLFVSLVSLVGFAGFSGCTFGGAGWSMGYKLSGVNIASDIRTCGVPQFQNKALLVQPQMAQKFTEKLRDKILAQSRLKGLAEMRGVMQAVSKLKGLPL